MSGPEPAGRPVPTGPAVADPRPRLDRLVARMVSHDPRPWGWRPALLPPVGLVLLIIAGNLISRLAPVHGFAGALTVLVGLSLLLYGGFVVLLVAAGRDFAARYAGWGWAFGLQRPRLMDAAWVAAGVGMVLGGRIAVVVVANALSEGTAAAQSQNLTVRTDRVAVYLLLAVVVVLVAPVLEEVMFRGLMLRTFMRRWGFWPAALVSSAVFALFHTYEVDTPAGAVTLAGVTFTLGLSNCLLVRWSGRITAGVIVHALFNGLAVTVLIVRAS